MKNDHLNDSWDGTVKTVLVIFAILEALVFVPIVVHKLTGG